MKLPPISIAPVDKDEVVPLRMRQKETVAARLARYSIPEPNSGCLLWVGSLDGGGHGHMKIEGRWEGAHRAAWAAARGPIPTGMWVLHKCDVRSCVNPDHLFLGTHQDNMDDMTNKGRATGSGNAKLDPKIASAIRESGLPLKEIMARFGVSKSTASRTRTGISWRPHPSREQKGFDQ